MAKLLEADSARVLDGILRHKPERAVPRIALAISIGISIALDVAKALTGDATAAAMAACGAFDAESARVVGWPNEDHFAPPFGQECFR